MNNDLIWIVKELTKRTRYEWKFNICYLDEFVCFYCSVWAYEVNFDVIDERRKEDILEDILEQFRMGVI